MTNKEKAQFLRNMADELDNLFPEQYQFKTPSINKIFALPTLNNKWGQTYEDGSGNAIKYLANAAAENHFQYFYWEGYVYIVDKYGCYSEQPITAYNKGSLGE